MNNTILTSIKVLSAAAILTGFCGCASSRYPMLSPTIRHTVYTPLPPLRQKTEDLAQSLLDSGEASHISVYFQSLNSGYWFGLNEHEKFKPASLMKFYWLIAAFKEAERNPDILKKQVTIDQVFDGMRQAFRPEEELVAGSTHTIAVLLERMIRYSDNTAGITVSYVIPAATLEQVYRDFAVPFDPNSDSDIVSVKLLSMALLSLYSSSYLSPANSQKALEILGGAEFDKGLRAGVPENVKVAHKFGERGVYNPDGSVVQQLHNCGIVYHPRFPYILSVMTRGEDPEKLASIITSISRMVYSEVNARKPSGAYGGR
jgi:beta-lactamase class A